MESGAMSSLPRTMEAIGPFFCTETKCKQMDFKNCPTSVIIFSLQSANRVVKSEQVKLY